MNIAIMPARGGSKRIARKNLKDFLGKPILSYPLRVLQQSDIFSRIVVSSDDSEILSLATTLGAEPLLRPEKLSDDFATTRDVVIHAINALGLESDSNVCCIYPTAVLVREQTLREGLGALAHFAFSFPVVAYDYPIWRAFERNEGGALAMLYPQHLETRSQDLPTIWHDAGQFYFGTARDWLGSIPLFGAQSYGIALGVMDAQDIDTMDDWAIAELKYALREKNGAKI
ncbi:MAG: pseudaminic acid cytidylyltransferase [Helicobacter sp.]|nr:pseudaminic acid cytidylyltransferase [Helicobacter sp.]